MLTLYSVGRRCCARASLLYALLGIDHWQERDLYFDFRIISKKLQKQIIKLKQKRKYLIPLNSQNPAIIAKQLFKANSNYFNLKAPVKQPNAWK